MKRAMEKPPWHCEAVLNLIYRMNLEQLRARGIRIEPFEWLPGKQPLRLLEIEALFLSGKKPYPVYFVPWSLMEAPREELGAAKWEPQENSPRSVNSGPTGCC